MPRLSIGVEIFVVVAFSLLTGACSQQRLLEDARKGSPDAIRELGRRKEKAAFDILRQIASQPDLSETDLGSSTMTPRQKYGELWSRQQTNQSHHLAKIALARLGDDAALNEFIVGLSSSSHVWQGKCMRDLGDIGDKRAVKYLIPFLNDDRDFGGGPHSIGAALALQKILPDAAKSFSKENGGQGIFSRNEWERWAKANSKSLQDK